METTRPANSVLILSGRPPNKVQNVSPIFGPFRINPDRVIVAMLADWAAAQFPAEHSMLWLNLDETSLPLNPWQRDGTAVVSRTSWGIGRRKDGGNETPEAGFIYLKWD